MKKGFTLIELMIVVVIIGILAAIAIPKFSDVAESAKRNACRANMRTIASQEVIYFASNNSEYGTLVEIGMDGVQCPSQQAGYTVTLAVPAGGVNLTSITIACPYVTSPHGNIDNGVASWTDSN